MCGNRTEIRDVTEPQTCEYVVYLATPLVCHPQSMLVFSTLNGELQDAWDEIEGLRSQNVLTEQVPSVFVRWFTCVAPKAAYAASGPSFSLRRRPSRAHGLWPPEMQPT